MVCVEEVCCAALFIGSHRILCISDVTLFISTATGVGILRLWEEVCGWDPDKPLLLIAFPLEDLNHFTQEISIFSIYSSFGFAFMLLHFVRLRLLCLLGLSALLE